MNKEELLKQLSISERYNSEVPAWVIDVIKGMPERTGRWEQSNPFTKPRCSECGESCVGLHGFDYTLTAYCPNCGCKMEVEHEQKNDLSGRCN